MSAKPTKVYPVRDRYLSDVPATVTTVATKEDAERLVESGAFTTNPNDPDRDKDAPDTTDEGPTEPERTTFPGEAEE